MHSIQSNDVNTKYLICKCKLRLKQLSFCGLVRIDLRSVVYSVGHFSINTPITRHFTDQRDRIKYDFI